MTRIYFSTYIDVETEGKSNKEKIEEANENAYELLKKNKQQAIENIVFLENETEIKE